MNNKLALIFDFDDTLVSDSTTQLLRQHGINAEEFWKEQRNLVRQGYESTLAYLSLLLDNVGVGKPFGQLSNKALNDFGASLDDKFYQGLPVFFDELKSLVSSYDSLSIEFYIISGGLQAIIEGSQMVKKYFRSVYGCTFHESGEPRMINRISRTISFTEKTRFIFEINKGIMPQDTIEKPFLVNQHFDQDLRRIPFRNMIYVGDGYTDIPCFSLLQKFGGMSFGVVDLNDEVKAGNAFKEFLIPHRVTSLHFPKYDSQSELAAMIKAAIASICNRIIAESKTFS